MTTYSVAEAKNHLPSLIDKALEGEEVVITRHGKPVAELRPRRQVDVTAARAMTEWLISRRHKDVGITSVELLDRIYEEDNQR
jgi:prevent-host-death family protein